MNQKSDLVILDGVRTYSALASEETLPLVEIHSRIKNLRILWQLLRYQNGKFYTFRVDLVRKPLAKLLIMRFLVRGKIVLADESGASVSINLRVFLNYIFQFILDLCLGSLVPCRVAMRLKRLQRQPYSKRFLKFELSSTRPIYVYSNLWFDISSGGSVTHVAGVLNNLKNFTAAPLFCAVGKNPLIEPTIESLQVKPARFWDFPILQRLEFSQLFFQNIMQAVQGQNVSFVYQRYALDNFTGVELAQALNVPLILEYNGSEVWIRKTWGQGRSIFERLSCQIENINLAQADIIVVVSDALRDELLALGIDNEKILVNYNGVDGSIFNPDIDGRKTREKYSLTDFVVIGFIGTFGKWHGAELLPEAINLLLSDYPAYRGKVRVLMIGDGDRMPRLKAIIAKHHLHDVFVLTGLVPQKDGPQYLAACDILASPHVPNIDGSRFFGSPTKLFEYMAMGKGIVASNLEQMGKILKHLNTAILVEPGNISALANGLKQLLDDQKLRHALGANARNEVLAQYTWKKHTQKIIQMLENRESKFHA